MERALEIARKSGADLPVGCIIVKDGEVLAAACNKKEALNDPTAHAEILAIREAAAKLGTWRLGGEGNCKMYVTLEPCPMCMWAILNARVDELYFGAYDTLYGAASSRLDLAPLLGSKIKIFGGILESECEKLLKDYFAKMRNRRSDAEAGAEQN